MDLDRLSVPIRPRNAWEAIDLGFAMARRWFLPLWLLWLSLALPLLLLAQLLFSERLVLAALLLWWCKPLYEPPLLFWLSRVLFGEPLTLRQVLQQWPAYGGRQLLANLSWRRFSPNRSFYMPVVVLEGLRGKARGQRIGDLGRNQHAPSWLTCAGLLFEFTLELSLLLLLWVMLPAELRPFDLQQLLLEAEGTRVQWLQNLVNLAAMSVIAPFYVAGGFALYLTRRSDLEAWDIEIGFRRLAARLSGGPGVATGLLLFSMLFFPCAGDALRAAGVESAQARAEIQVVLADDAFGKHRQEGRWVYRGSTGLQDRGAFWVQLAEWFRELGQALARGGEFLLWVAAGLLLAWLSYRIFGDIRGRGGKAVAGAAPASLPITVSVPDLSGSSLPRRLAQAARSELEAGRLREALGLLYRGALARERYLHQLAIPDSATEEECLALLQEARPATEARFFRQLSQSWVQLAYGGDPPSRERLDGLCREWELIFEGAVD